MQPLIAGHWKMHGTAAQLGEIAAIAGACTGHIPALEEIAHVIEDFGAHCLNAADDYPDFIIPLARAVASGQVERAVALCGSGVGASVAANKIV